MNNWLAWGGVFGGAVAFAQVAWAIYKDHRSGAVRLGQAEAAKASLDAQQAAQSLPHVQESLKLGNLSEAVSIQQQIINGLREHAAWQDEQLKEKDREVVELRQRLTERDQKVELLEERLDAAEEALNIARRIIEELRTTSRTETEREQA